RQYSIQPTFPSQRTMVPSLDFRAVRPGIDAMADVRRFNKPVQRIWRRAQDLRPLAAQNRPPVRDWLGGKTIAYRGRQWLFHVSLGRFRSFDRPVPAPFDPGHQKSTVERDRGARPQRIGAPAELAQGGIGRE